MASSPAAPLPVAVAASLPAPPASAETSRQTAARNSPQTAQLAQQTLPQQTQESTAENPSTAQAAKPAKKTYKPGERFRDCEDDTHCPWLRVIPAGRFLMGSPADEPERFDDEGPQHRVTIRQPFAVMETEVTVGMFRLFAKTNGNTSQAGCDWKKPFGTYQQTAQDPVVCVSWHDAQAFAKWLSGQTGEKYRLLSEAEWEYVARAKTDTAYWFGDQASEICRYANVADCDIDHTTPVGRYPKNPWGLFDVVGNAWEWVQDCKADYRAGDTNEAPVESGNCSGRVLRGGAWSSFPRYARSAFRNDDGPSDRSSSVGFRLARMLPSGS
jgi:formylglycine-generating enzyme required for sulfatase activity